MDGEKETGRRDRATTDILYTWLRRRDVDKLLDIGLGRAIPLGYIYTQRES